MNKEAMKQQIVEALSKKSGNSFVTVVRNTDNIFQKINSFAAGCGVCGTVKSTVYC